MKKKRRFWKNERKRRTPAKNSVLRGGKNRFKNAHIVGGPRTLEPIILFASLNTAMLGPEQLA